MDYQRIYREFIADRKAKPKPEGYTERHHILPRSMGGGNEPANLIVLTAEDHFFAHLLLAKVHGRGMWVAVCRMRWGRVGGERPWIKGRPMYAYARRRFAEENSRRCLGQPGNKGSVNGRYNPEQVLWTNLDTGETTTASRWEMWDRYGGGRATWTSVASGTRKSFQGWTTSPDSIRIRGNKGKSFTFVNRDGRSFTGRQGEFAKLAGVSAASASRVVRHFDVTKCGWRLDGNPDRRHWICRDGRPSWQIREEKKRAAIG